MELRLLRYFLTVAKEQSFTKAAEQLHITQPTLSRQMAAFEEELGVTLFIRSGKKISLTEEGILLKRRALEILNLEEKTLEELKGKEDVVEGTITIGCGEFAAVETLAEICKTYKEKYPLVQIVLHTATADAVYEMMNKGLVDIALFLEPVDTEGLDYIWITDSSLKYHLQNAKNHGVTQKEIAAVITHVAFYAGWPKAWAVFNLAKEVWETGEGDLPYEEEAMRAHAKEMVFPIGAPNDGFAQYFSGRSFLAPISTSQVGIFNVTFEPGCRNNWHIHHAKSGGGQILVCVAGRGYYQEEGKDAVEMKPGDCINIPAEVKHWHGAAPDEWFSHLAIEVPGENSSNEWLEPVSDEEYGKLQ